MDGLFVLIAVAAGFPMLLIGYIWLLVASKPFGAVWVFANMLIAPVIVLLLYDWQRAWPALRLPLIFTLIGFVLVMVALGTVDQA